MEIENYKSNSHKSKESREEKLPVKKTDKIISGTAKQRKKSEIRKFTDVFISEDVENVKTYILVDILVPAVKKAISDIVTNGIDMLLYGESKKDSGSTAASKVSYRSYYDKRNESSRERYSSRSVRSGYDYDDVVLDSKGAAESVLSRMDELVSVYGMVSVADLYDLVGITGNYTDNKYGWTDIRNASVVRIRDGYVIKMPRALPLDTN